MRPRFAPPSESDLTLLKSVHLCDKKTAFLQTRQELPLQREAWGSGEELRIPANKSESGADESFFFDEDGLLVGALFLFPGGRDLKPYPVLRQTLSQLKPVLEFYTSLAQAPSRANMDSSALYQTGGEKTTDQYIILGEVHSSSLLLASVSIDPYASLLSPYRKEFIGRMARSEKSKGGIGQEVRGAVDKEPFLSLQQFARGETAQLAVAYCGVRDHKIAVAAYSKAIASGFSDKVQLAEAHHKLGLALKATGQLEQARGAIQKSLEIHPNRPDVLNNLGDVYRELGDKKKALATFERAVTLMPNYPIARFNLAEAYVQDNPKLALSEYETYLALVEGVPEEKDRIARAKKRVKALTSP
ncbi:MAG: tetratricopeptide repeat protein [Nitrospirae bacterium]|nr:tetratricopeptide repeat protein [Nitrospirota bacterium]